MAQTPETNFELSDLHELIDKMILLLSPQSKNRNIKVGRYFSNRIGLVWMDAEKMKQVILNILANAAEFTPEGGSIDVFTRLRYTTGNSPCVEVEIRDSGPGIPAAMIDNIFDPYFTTKHKSTIHKGTGLGLFIAHKHMQDHGGTIEVKSLVDQGTTFILNLPNTAPDATTQSPVNIVEAI